MFGEIMNNLTIDEAQARQPWTVPYSADFEEAAQQWCPHLHGAHAVLHGMKSLGKLAAEFEAADHGSDIHRAVVRDMAADLMTIALRLANLYGFELSAELVRRVQEKNGVNIAQTP